MREEHQRAGRVLRVVATLGALAAMAGPLGAQAPDPHGGFWMGGGVGLGLGRAHCDICRNDRDDAMSATLRFGGTASQHVLLGIEGDAWRKRLEAVNVTLGTVAAAAYWYPSPHRTPWYVKGGLGVVAYRVASVDGEEEPITAKSLAGHFGAGYDIRIVPALSLTPYFNFVSSMFADLQSGRELLTDVNLTLIQFGMGVTMH